MSSLKFNDSRYNQIGKNLFEKDKVYIEESLTKLIYKENILDGSQIQASWFPQADANIFISHSHKDKDVALSLAGWLWDSFELKTFIDSMVWGYSKELLKSIDDEHSMNADKSFYSYDARNISTSHVHMMLSTALAMMIDKTECLFFLDTPNSVVPVEGIKHRTESPWLYFELATTKLVEIKTPRRPLFEGDKYFSKGVQATYDVDFSHLTSIGADELNRWEDRRGIKTAENALDMLYQLCPPKKNSTSLSK